MLAITEFTPQTRLFNSDEYFKMAEVGILKDDEAVELINGKILKMSPVGFSHSGHVNRLTKLLTLLVADKAIVSVQNPLQLGNISEPEPDLMLLKPEDSFYSTRHPHASDVLLLIEVSNTTLTFDRSKKMALYAQYQIPEYWILNLTDQCLEVYRQPEHNKYTQQQILTKDDSIQLLLLPEINSNLKSMLF
jgi:Uma2 family endonuclease